MRTAEDLHVTPSAVTHRIKQLQLQTGIRLFANKQFDLTGEGMAYLHRVRTAFNVLGAGGPDAGLSERIRLRVAVPPTFSRQILIPILPTFFCDCKEIDLSIQTMIPGYNVRADDVDLEIRFGEAPDSRCECIPLQTDRLKPVCSKAYSQKFGPFSDFDTEEVIMRARSLASPLEPWLPWFAEFGLTLPEPEGGVEFNDLGLLYDAAAAGLRGGTRAPEAGRSLALRPKTGAHHKRQRAIAEQLLPVRRTREA